MPFHLVDGSVRYFDLPRSEGIILLGHAEPPAIDRWIQAQITELMDRFDSKQRHGGLAVEGVAATLGALAQRRVHTLLVADDPDDERVAWFGPDRLCAEMPSSPPQTTSWEAAGRLVDIAVRAAVLTGADINVIPTSHSPALGERIGALCRFVQTAP